MSLYIAARRHADSNGTQQNGNKTGETEEAPCAIDGVLDLRARFTDVAQSLATLLSFGKPRLEGRHLLTLASEQRCVSRSRTRLQQACGWQIIGMHQQAWRELAETTALIGSCDQYFGDQEGCSTNRHRIAQLGIESRKQFRVRPNLAARWSRIDGSRRPERLSRDAHRATQGITAADRAQIRELVEIVAKHDAQHRGCIGRFEAATIRFVEIGRRYRPRGLEPQVCSEHLIGLQSNRLTDAIDEESHPGQRTYGHRQRQQ